MSCYLGIDIGSSGTKTLAIDVSGNVLAESVAEYPVHQPRPGWTEQDPEDWFRWCPANADGLDDDAIKDLVRQRTEARGAKDFATSDRIRDELAEAGVVLEDKSDGTIWRRS